MTNTDIRPGQIWEHRTTGRQVEVIDPPVADKVFVQAARQSTIKLENFVASYHLVQDVATTCAECGHDPERHWLAPDGARLGARRGCSLCGCHLTRAMARA